MAIQDNIDTIKGIEEYLACEMPVPFGVNKRNELIRLIYEIARSGGVSPDDVIRTAGLSEEADAGRDGLFRRMKERLVKIRYPSSGNAGTIRLMPVKMEKGDRECDTWDGIFTPEEIFLERSVAGLDWTERFLARFPQAKKIPIERMSDITRMASTAGSVKEYNERRKRVFLVRNKTAFIKTCPCSQGCVRCGYWILNVGFGCPIDCSYCYLQVYSNAPGIVLPANIEDFENAIKELDGRSSEGTRIGTGEFTDSLALDPYTGYSGYLVPMFRKTRNLVLELKTKTTNIGKLLEQEPSDNVVISWSVNTPRMAEMYEKGGARMEERIRAALEAVKHGYGIAFHFDPVIFHSGWEEEYRSFVRHLFGDPLIRDNTRWVSLGTLRYSPGLKQVTERRFPDNGLFYAGEFYQDDDGKMRYPEEVRAEIYRNMNEWIRDAGVRSWMYLCMETDELWKRTGIERRPYRS